MEGILPVEETKIGDKQQPLASYLLLLFYLFISQKSDS